MHNDVELVPTEPCIKAGFRRGAPLNGRLIASHITGHSTVCFTSIFFVETTDDSPTVGQ